LIVTVDIIGFVLSVAASVVVLVNRNKGLRVVDFALIVGVLSITAIISLGNVFEWSGITRIFDSFEDYLSILMAAFWGFFLVSLIQYQYEKAFEQSEAQYYDLVQSANSIILRMSPTGHVTFLNRYGLEFFEYTENEISGRHVVGTIVPETESSGRDLAKMIEDICVDAERFRLNENENMTKSGKRVWVSWTNRPIFDVNGRLAEILCIGNDITRIKNAERFLKRSLEEKEVLLKEIHHRVKNNLQVISGLMSLQSMHVDNSRTRNVFKESENRIISMSLIHQDLYQSKELTKVDCGAYIRNLVNNLNLSYNTHGDEVRLAAEIDDLQMSLDTAVPCGLIINELVTNALVHAFPEGRSGDVYVKFRSQGDDKYLLAVKDNGVGLPEDLDPQNSRSLGLQLVVVLAEQMKADIDWNRKSGTSFVLKFKEYHEAGTALF
jgi:two-component system sensor kinase